MSSNDSRSVATVPTQIRLGAYWWRNLGLHESEINPASVVRPKEACVYALFARDRKTGQWLNQNGQPGSRVVGTDDYVLNRGLAALVIHNPHLCSEIVVKKITVGVEGGEKTLAVPTAKATQEVYLHLFLPQMEGCPKKGAYTSVLVRNGNTNAKRWYKVVELTAPQWDGKVETIVDSPEKASIVTYVREHEATMGEKRQEALKAQQALRDLAAQEQAAQDCEDEPLPF